MIYNWSKKQIIKVKESRYTHDKHINSKTEHLTKSTAWEKSFKWSMLSCDYHLVSMYSMFNIIRTNTMSLLLLLQNKHVLLLFREQEMYVQMV